MGYTFKHSKGVALVRCPKCEAENYTMAVMSGVCVWCGYDANKEDTNGKDK